MSNVCAVIVTYYAEPAELNELLESLERQVQGMVIVDNTPNLSLSDWFQAKKTNPSRQFIALNENSGVASAHNKGIAWAKSQGYSHVLLMDQDSRPDGAMVARLLAVSDQLISEGDKIAVVGPSLIDERTNVPQRLQYFEVNQNNMLEYHQLEYVITSGSLITVEIFDKLGLYDESLFIDYVDIEWGLRAISKGYKNCCVNSAVLYHRLGDRLIKLPWRSISCRSPLRHYYAFRNATLLYKRSYISLCWKLKDAVRNIAKFALYSLFMPPRLKQFIMMSKGILHGILGRTGRIDESARSRLNYNS